MSEVKKLIKGVQACEKFAKQLELHNVTVKELEILGEIAPSVLGNIQFLRDWVSGVALTTTTEEVLAETEDTTTEETIKRIVGKETFVNLTDEYYTIIDGVIHKKK